MLQPFAHSASPALPGARPPDLARVPDIEDDADTSAGDESGADLGDESDRPLGRTLTERVVSAGAWRVRPTGRMNTDNGIAWTGDILKDSTKVGSAEDRGDGGQVRVRFSPRGPESAALHAEFCAAAKVFEPANDFEVDGSFASALADLADEAKSVQRWAKTKTVFRMKGDNHGEWRTINRPYTEAGAAALRAKHADLIEFGNEAVASY